MDSVKALVFAFVMGACSLIAVEARADLPPPGACTGTVGTPCNTAGQNADQPGTCQDATCNRATPDGSTTYPCVLCKASDGGGSAGASGSGGGAATGGSGGGTSTSSKSSSSSGCSLVAVPRGDAAGGWLLLVGLGALLWTRRR